MVKRYRTALARRLGRNVAAYRHRAALTQEQLADLIEVEVATVSRYETGAALPSLVTLETLADALHCTVAELLAEKAIGKSTESARIAAMIEPLVLAERELVVQMIESVIGFLHQRRKVGRPRKRAPLPPAPDGEVS